VVSVSNKVHTTGKRSTSVYTEGDTQLVLLDSPGVVSTKEARKYKLPDSFIEDPVSTSEEADVIAVIHDVTNPFTLDHLDSKVHNILRCFENKDSVLVLNKVSKSADIVD
jgi:GTPase Era involved in 16S rRNA processing